MRATALVAAALFGTMLAAWAPNGRHIACVTTRGGKGEQITVMSLDGKNVRQVTLVGNNRYPSWSASPKGR